MEPRAEAIVVLENPSGLHARLAAVVVRAAQEQAQGALVTLTNLDRDAGRAASAASIVALLGLGAGPGDRLHVEARGTRADEAVDAVRAVLSAGGAGERER